MSLTLPSRVMRRHERQFRTAAIAQHGTGSEVGQPAAWPVSRLWLSVFASDAAGIGLARLRPLRRWSAASTSVAVLASAPAVTRCSADCVPECRRLRTGSHPGFGGSHAAVGARRGDCRQLRRPRFELLRWRKRFIRPTDQQPAPTRLSTSGDQAGHRRAARRGVRVGQRRHRLCRIRGIGRVAKLLRRSRRARASICAGALETFRRRLRHRLVDERLPASARAAAGAESVVRHARARRPACPDRERASRR